MWQDVRQSAICEDVESDQIRRSFDVAAEMHVQVFSSNKHSPFRSHTNRSREIPPQLLNAPSGWPTFCNFVLLSASLNAIRIGHRHWEQTVVARHLWSWSLTSNGRDRLHCHSQEVPPLRQSSATWDLCSVVDLVGLEVHLVLALVPPQPSALPRDLGRPCSTWRQTASPCLSPCWNRSGQCFNGFCLSSTLTLVAGEWLAWWGIWEVSERAL